MKRIFPLFAATAIFFLTGIAFAGEWSGRVSGKNGQWSFRFHRVSYNITNPEKAKDFDGKRVKVVGTLDEATKSITIDSISGVARAAGTSTAADSTTAPAAANPSK